jgi:hypothetical protein
MKNKRIRNPDIAYLPVVFEAHEKYVVAIFDLDGSTIGVRFTSPEKLMIFFSELMEKAVTVWPDNELIKEYLS